MFGIFWNNNDVISSSPPNNYDIESASYLQEKKIQIEEQYKHNFIEEIVSVEEQYKHNFIEEIVSVEIKNEANLNKSVFPIVPPIKIIKSNNLIRPYSSSANSSPINTNKIIKQNQAIGYSLSTNNLNYLNNIDNLSNDSNSNSISIKVEVDEEDLDNKKENTELKLYNETLEKINKLKEEDLNADTEVFADYILKDSVRPYNDNSYYCQFLWSGIEHLDHWELKRKLNKDNAKTILSQMKKDYNKKNKFIFYDVIHLRIKPDGNYDVIDGQDNLVAYYNLYLKNLYPIQKIPAVIWETSSDDEFLEIYERINDKLS
jgi:hypothetical protein